MPQEPEESELIAVAKGISDRLGRIGNLLALLAVRELEEDDDKVHLLTGVGFSPAEVGALLGKKANTISATLYRARKRRG